MRAIAALVVSVLAIAGAVLYASEAQRSTAETNFREARIADQLRVLMLEEVRAANRYMTAGNWRGRAASGRVGGPPRARSAVAPAGGAAARTRSRWMAHQRGFGGEWR